MSLFSQVVEFPIEMNSPLHPKQTLLKRAYRRLDGIPIIIVVVAVDIGVLLDIITAVVLPIGSVPFIGYVPFAPPPKNAPGLIVGYADGIPILVLVLELTRLKTDASVSCARTSLLLDFGAVMVMVEVRTVVTVLQTGMQASASASGSEGLKKVLPTGAEGKMVMVSVTVVVPVVIVVVGSSAGMALPAKMPAPGGRDIVTAGTKSV